MKICQILLFYYINFNSENFWLTSSGSSRNFRLRAEPSWQLSSARLVIYEPSQARARPYSKQHWRAEQSPFTNQTPESRSPLSREGWEAVSSASAFKVQLIINFQARLVFQSPVFCPLPAPRPGEIQTAPNKNPKSKCKTNTFQFQTVPLNSKSIKV